MPERAGDRDVGAAPPPDHGGLAAGQGDIELKGGTRLGLEPALLAAGAGLVAACLATACLGAAVAGRVLGWRHRLSIVAWGIPVQHA